MSLADSGWLLPLVSALGLLIASGFGSLFIGARSERWSVWLGAGGAVTACATGLVASLGALLSKADDSLILPWRIPYGELNLGLDVLSAFFLIPLFLLSSLVAVYSIGYFHPWQGRNPGRFWLFMNGLTTSMALVMLARNGVMFLVMWEVMTLASFFLVIFDDQNTEAGLAGWIYLVATHISTAFLICLFLLLGRESGSQDFAMYAAPAGVAGTAFMLGLIGFGTKAGLYPLHVWLQVAHPAAPSPVSAVMSGIMIKTGIYGLTRLFIILGNVPVWCAWLVLLAGAVSGIMGILFALAQSDLKRLLAYSSVENIGIITVGIGLGVLGKQLDLPVLATLGFAGALLHVFNHAIFKGLMFLGAGAVVHATGTRAIEQLGGMLKKMPWTGTMFFGGAVAICGLPPLNGFMGEFLLYAGAIKGILGSGGAAVAGVISVVSLALIGGLAVVCFTKAFGIVFLGEPRSEVSKETTEVDWSMRVPMLTLAVLCLVVGLSAGLVVRGIEPVVAALAGLPPDITMPSVVGALFPIALFGLAALLLIILALLVVARRRLLAGRVRHTTVTWDCGYAAPAASMQYTATGFVQPLTRAAENILRPQVDSRLPLGIYPVAGEFHLKTPDAVRQFFFNPLFRRAARRMEQLRWLQQGRVHWYVFYVVMVLVILLGWALWS